MPVGKIDGRTMTPVFIQFETDEQFQARERYGYVANAQSANSDAYIYHRSDCRALARPSDKTRVGGGSSLGKHWCAYLDFVCLRWPEARPCKVCRPDLPPWKYKAPHAFAPPV